MVEILFYHLERRALDAVLPRLLERSLERGWRCAVEATDPARLGALDDVLWTYADDSFLPHGTLAEGAGEASTQPILLLTGPANPNGARVRFLVDGAPLPADAERYDRVVLIFDGNDPAAVAAAREQWRAARGRGLAATYWQETADGGFERRA